MNIVKITDEKAKLILSENKSYDWIQTSDTISIDNIKNNTTIKYLLGEKGNKTIINM